MRLDLALIENEEIRKAFRDRLFADVKGSDLTGESIIFAFYLVAKELLPQEKATVRKPWISNKTLELIDRRNDLRIVGKHREEIELQKEIKKSVKHDRCNYLDELVGAGMWS